MVRGKSIGYIISSFPLIQDDYGDCCMFPLWYAFFDAISLCLDDRPRQLCLVYHMIVLSL